MSVDIQNGRLIAGGFNSDHGMLLCFGVYTGTLSFPSRSTGSQTQAWNVSSTAASGINSLATFASGMGKLTASGYFTTNWFSFGGSAVPVWIDDSSGGFDAKYQVWVSIGSGNLYVKGRQYISNHSKVGSATVSYRVALLGFASKT
ncbi:hypothetical protein LP7551_02057 [Roseibium album]|nr:hypothetical protein LP7551_02057 [Roseibium album]